MPIDPFLGYGAMQLGSSLAGWLGGNDDPYKAQREQGIQGLMNMRGQNVIDVPNAIARNRAAMIPQANKKGKEIDKHLDLDSGFGQSEMMKYLFDSQTGFNLDASMENDRLKSRRDLAANQFLAGGLPQYG